VALHPIDPQLAADQVITIERALTFVAVSCVFLTVAAVSCFVPARQVTAIDPLTALRVE
jgi:ABC-type lipoprotein release transport system permease subunit